VQRWRDGMNTQSDTRVVRPDGKTPLDDRDTVMAFLTHADALEQPGFRWMDVLALQRMYGAGGTETGVRQPSGGSGSCNAKT
jgi:hypothetical protein